MNKIFCGDCLFVMRHDLLERGIKVDLIYLDPPFFTGKVQKGKVWHPEAMEISFEDSKQFWRKVHKSQIGNAWAKAPEWLKHIAVKQPEFGSYLYYMMRRLELCKRVLKCTGSIYLHCDYRASHYLKMVMDEIFGVENFRNEIVWCYAGGGGVPKDAFARKHDIILFYSKTRDKRRVFNIQRKPYGEMGSDKKWRRADGSKLLKEGKHMEDWWMDVNPILPLHRAMYGGKAEHLGYPTQKPEALLERIIKASSNSMDIVFDPFCGCGSAIVVAHKLGRRWMGIDISADACRVMQKRFEDSFNIKPEIYWRTKETVEKMENPMEFEVWVNEYYNAKKPSPDLGVDGITPEGIPIQTKTHIVRYNVVSQFLNDIKYHPKITKPIKQGIIVSQKGFDGSAISRAFEIEKKEGVKIELITPEKMLGESEITRRL